MTRHSETFATQVWCQAGRRLHRSPNPYRWLAAVRALGVALLVGYLAMALVSAFRHGVDDLQKGLENASVSEASSFRSV